MKNSQPRLEEFEIKAIKQFIQRGHKLAEKEARIGVSQHSLHKWIKGCGLQPDHR